MILSPSFKRFAPLKQKGSLSVLQTTMAPRKLRMIIIDFDIFSFDNLRIRFQLILKQFFESFIDNTSRELTTMSSLRVVLNEEITKLNPRLTLLNSLAAGCRDLSHGNVNPSNISMSNIPVFSKYI